VRLQQTTWTSFGGKCWAFSVLTRLKMNSFTVALISCWICTILFFCASVASGSRPLKIGNSIRFRNCSSVPNTPALVKSTMLKNSCKSFCIGVPVNKTRRFTGNEFSARDVWFSLFLRRWACVVPKQKEKKNKKR